MASFKYLRHTIIVALLLFSVSSFAQSGPDIRGNWSVSKFEPEKDSPQAKQAQQELAGVQMTFDKAEILITKKNEAGEDVIKKMPYSLSGNIITLGDSNAEIIAFTKESLTIKIVTQGILYLSKNAGKPERP